MISYEPFWNYIREHGISTYKLINDGINPDVIQRLRSGKNISTKTLNQLCIELGCSVPDILVFVPVEDEENA
ncbi:MAG: helix-turn-helix transcriptional regulator [Ruminococcus flavefaciens]|nr:helix-turn-helix transcriptional regulator [Ruminococcus flavefaciens]